MSRASRRSPLLLTALAGVLAFTPPSDPIAAYAIIDRVVLSPDSGAATTVEVWGVFSLATLEMGDHYTPPLKGYLYFRTDPANEQASRIEWADMKQAAGTGQIIGFGTRYAKNGGIRIRCATEPKDSPDVYQTAIGMVRNVGAAARYYGPGSGDIYAQLTAQLQTRTAPPAPCLKKG